MATSVGSAEAGEIEARLRRYDGDYRWFLFRVEPVRDSHGHIFKWYGANTDIEDRQRAEALLAAEKRTLEMIASGACLADILERLCETIDAQASNIKSAVMLMDADGMHLRQAAGPRVPRGWVEVITPLKIGPCVGSCGSAAFLKQRVIVLTLQETFSGTCFVLRVAHRMLSAAPLQEPTRTRHLQNVLSGGPHPEPD